MPVGFFYLRLFVQIYMNHLISRFVAVHQMGPENKGAKTFRSQ